MNELSHQLLLDSRESSPFFTTYPIKTEPEDILQTPEPYLYPLLNESRDIYEDSFSAAGSATTYQNLVPAEINSVAQPNDTFSINYGYSPTFHKMDPKLTGNVRDEGIGSSPLSSQSITPPIDFDSGIRDFNALNESGNSSTRDSGAHEAGPSSPIFEAGDTPPPSFSLQCVKCGCFNLPDQCWKTADGHILCNACYSETLVNVHPEPEKKKKKSAMPKATRNQNCSNCGTNTTTLWRRDQRGGPICNPCGLYFKLHNINRPLTMKKDSIQRRNRGKGAGKQKNGVPKQRNGASRQSNGASNTSSAGASPLQSYVRPPPPPYQIFTTDDYQYIPPLENIGYCGNYNQEMNFSHF